MLTHYITQRGLDAALLRPRSLAPNDCHNLGQRVKSFGTFKQLAEFALHGARYAFDGVFAPGSEDYVWPHPNGTKRGVGVEPLHPNVPFAAMQDAKLYEMLALFDALRVGRARDGLSPRRAGFCKFFGNDSYSSQTFEDQLK